MPSPNIWIAASDNDVSAVAQFLAQDPSSVNARDDNGYTPLHAAASYNHIELLKMLVQTYGANPNITDLDGDTPLFVCETVEAARCLVEELGADINHRNSSGSTALETIEEDGEFPLVAAYLRERGSGAMNGAPSTNAVPPPPPSGVQVSYSTIDDSTEMEPPVDDELRRRIDELARRDDFSSEEAQRELRDLIAGAVRDHVTEADPDRNVRARLGEH